MALLGEAVDEDDRTPHRETPARAAPRNPRSGRISYEELTQAGSRRSPIRCHNSAGTRESRVSADFSRLVLAILPIPEPGRALGAAAGYSASGTPTFSANVAATLGPPQDAAFILPSAVPVFWLPAGCGLVADLIAPRVLLLLHPVCGIVAPRVPLWRHSTSELREQKCGPSFAKEVFNQADKKGQYLVSEVDFVREYLAKDGGTDSGR